MALSPEYIEYLKDQFRALGEIEIKKMFGGAGLYLDSPMFALIANETLYLKVDEQNRSDYEALGLEPFKPFDDKPMTMSYYEVPADILENREELAQWASKAIEAAERAKK